MAAQIKAAKISPCGNVLRLDFQDSATGPGPTDVVSVAAGCTLTVNGTALPLTNGFWPTATDLGTEAGSWVQWPLAASIFEIGVGKLDAGYSETGGGWARVTSSQGFADSDGQPSPSTTWSYRSTSDGAATARYHFGEGVFIAPGRFRLSASLMWICGRPGLTTNATYTVLDSDGTTVLATFHADQTSQALAFNRVDRQLHLTDLGTFTAAGVGFTVVVSNGAGVPFGSSVDDKFARADSSAVGNGWVDTHGGIWAISGGKLVSTADGNSDPIDNGYDLLRPAGEDGLNLRVSATVPVPGGRTGNNWYATCIARYNRTTHDKYFCFLTWADNGPNAAIIFARSIGGVTALVSGGVFGFGPLAIGHPTRLDLTATGSNPTTLTATVTDLTAGSVLMTASVTDSSATLQAAGGMGVSYDGGTAGDTCTYAEVVATNLGAGNGSTLVTDYLFIETVQPRTVPLGATCTFDSPSGTAIVCKAGNVPQAVAMPAKLTVDMHPTDPSLSWLKYVDLGTPHPMVLGYNKVFPDQSDLPNRAFFNVLRGGTGWTRDGTVTNFDSIVDQPTGEMTGAPPLGGGQLKAYWYSNLGNQVDTWGYLNNPRATKWRFEFDFTPHGEAGGIPNCGFVASSTDATIGTPDGPHPVAGSTTRWYIEADIALNLTPDPSNWPGSGFSPNYGGQVAIRTLSQIDNISITDVGNHRGWTRKCHPEFYKLMSGRNFGDIRFLDAIPTNDGVAVNAGELAPASGRFCNKFSRYICFTTVARIDPVDLTPADTNDALKWFQREDHQAVVLLTTSSPHGLTTGHRPRLFFDPAWGNPASFPMNIGGMLTFNFSFETFIVVVLSPTTMLMMTSSDTAGKTADGLPPATLATGHDMTINNGVGLQMQADAGECIEDCIAIAVECGCVPWLNVPLTLNTSGLNEYVARTLAATPLGQKIRIEHFNEPWNFVGPFQWMLILANHLVYQNAHGTSSNGSQYVGHNQMQCIAYLSNITFKAFRAAWVAAGRDPTEVIRVCNTQAGGPDGNTKPLLSWWWQAGQVGQADGFDELSGDCYQGATETGFSIGINTQDGPGQTFNAFVRLDVAGTVSALGPIATAAGRTTQVRQQLDVLAGTLRDNASPFFLRPGQDWAGTGFFSNVKYTNYEGGFASIGMRQTLNDTRTGPDAGDRSTRLSRSVGKHPRMYWVELARLAELEAAGVSRSVRFSLNFPQANQNNWYDYDTYNMGVGTGNPAENPNPLDMPNVVSQLGGAFRAFAGAGLTTATAYTIATASTGTVGVGQTVTVAPNGPYTGTITLAATHGTLATTVFTFNSAAPQTTTFTPTLNGAALISGTNGGGLANPPPFGVTVAAPGATLYTFFGIPAFVPAGFPIPLTLTPDGVTTATVTLVPAGCILSATTVTFAGSGSMTVLVTATGPGPGSITAAGNTGGLANPAAIHFTAFPAAAMSSGIRLGGRGRGSS